MANPIGTPNPQQAWALRLAVMKEQAEGAPRIPAAIPGVAMGSEAQRAATQWEAAVRHPEVSAPGPKWASTDGPGAAEWDALVAERTGV